jgi:hypothetical protein
LLAILVALALITLMLSAALLTTLTGLLGLLAWLLLAAALLLARLVLAALAALLLPALIGIIRHDVSFRKWLSTVSQLTCLRRVPVTT